MDIKIKLKERLLEIPSRHRAYREVYRLSHDLNIEAKDIKPLLTELLEKGILTEKIEYICPNCRNTEILDNDLLNQLIIEDSYFECDECNEYIDSSKDKTGYTYYDIKNKQALINW